MSIISSIFRKNSTPKISTNKEFWIWFLKNEHTYFKLIQSKSNIEKEFFPKLTTMLNQLHEGIFFLVGMSDKNTAELTLSADGNVKVIPYIEDLIREAPNIPGWKFTPLKSATAIEDMVIRMADITFSKDNLFFYAKEHINTEDEIDLVIVHADFKESARSNFTIGTSIFLENYLGELNMVTMIDELEVIGKAAAVAKLIPISKLKDYLIWREKEFVEKYGDLVYLNEEDNFSCLEADLENGKPLVAIVNSSVLEWEGKASHPWIMAITIKYNGENLNGMPDQITYDLLNQFEDRLLEMIEPKEGLLNIGRETADGLRTLFFASADFRKPVYLVDRTIREFIGKLDVDYSIYKDKYWQTFKRFIPLL